MTQVDGGGVPSGTQLNGIYEIEKRIAMGGMGEVYIGKLIQTGDRVAIKMILPEHANNEIIVDLFRKEASTLHNLYHEAIVRYYVFSVDPDLNRPYIAMEFADGPAISDRLKAGQTFSEAEMDVLRRRVAGGLHTAHKLGIIHRDISPDNVILIDGNVEKAKIIDFGIAKSTSSTDGTLIGSGFAGKLNYVSPEQLGLAGGEVSAKSDIYALGLVFAEAVIGHPLPMGGSQVEVVDKRREVPDLSEVPVWIRPLIEAMIQPDPANRPEDMEAVANWTNSATQVAPAPFASPSPSPAAVAAASTGAVEAGPAAPRPVHPRERRRQQEQENTGTGGPPWKWIGIGGAGLAAAAAIAYVLIGNPGGFGSGDEPIGQQTNTVTLNTPAVLPVPPTATMGQAYRFVSAPFEYTGDPSALRFEVEGDLAPGLGIAPTGDGGVTISGTPTEAGGGFAIVATDPDGLTARQEMAIDVTGTVVETTPVPPATLSAPAVMGVPPAANLGDEYFWRSAPFAYDREPSQLVLTVEGSLPPGLSLTPAGDGSFVISGVPTASGGPVSVLATSPEGLEARQDFEITITEDIAPQVGGGTSPTLLTPGGDQDSGVGDLATGSDSTPQPGQGGSPILGTGGSTVSTPTVPKSDPEPQAPKPEDPAEGSTEPNVNTGVGTLTAPSDGTGSVSVNGGSDGGITAPPTGGGQIQQPQGGQGNTQLSAIPKPENQPPTLRNAHQGAVNAVQGEAINLVLGSFFDEEGPTGLTLNVDGTLPAGISIRLVDGGTVQLFGTATEFGTFAVQIAAVDPQGLVSRPASLSLVIAQPSAHSTVRDYILGYDGGTCFLSRPVTLAERTAQIEVFAAQVPPAIAFDSDFKRDQGFEANIGVRLISDAQCPLINALDQVGPQAMDNSLVITLARDELTSGDRLQGVVKGGEGARLFLFDHLGGLTDLSARLTPGAGGASFGLPVQAEGPQILIATKPRPGSGVSADLTLEELLGAAQKGQASIALGFFIMNGRS